jgi:hypothetical protein
VAKWRYRTRPQGRELYTPAARPIPSVHEARDIKDTSVLYPLASRETNELRPALSSIGTRQWLSRWPYIWNARLTTSPDAHTEPLSRGVCATGITSSSSNAPMRRSCCSASKKLDRLLVTLPCKTPSPSPRSDQDAVSCRSLTVPPATASRREGSPRLPLRS